MNVDEALRQFVAAEQLPRAAMQWALDHWDEASPRFIARLRAFAAGANRSDAAMDELFYIVHLCGEKRDERAYGPLCRLIGESEEASDFLGDADGSTLKGILINVCDGDPAPLMRAIESPAGQEFARASALEALGYLARARNVLSDDEMRAYLKRLRREMKPRGECYLWTAWAATAANLGYDDLRLDVAILIKDRFIGEGEYSLADFDQQMKMAREDPTGLSGFQGDFVGPLEGSIETLAQWSNAGEDEFDEEDGERRDDEAGFEAPYVNPFREVGRNDPCPCGSGKKYKKCCLAD
ncbi:MAG TPA: DUF1186 domain-containing protein [Roseiarcus sp.]|nr:DUF1186 domain-containing protein [Roseiarcus sp.]